jgi:hypothetical protein
LSHTRPQGRETPGKTFEDKSNDLDWDFSFGFWLTTVVDVFRDILSSSRICKFFFQSASAFLFHGVLFTADSPVCRRTLVDCFSDGRSMKRRGSQDQFAGDCIRELAP